MSLLSRVRNAEPTRNLLLKEVKKDPPRVDILQDIARMYYVQENYDSAYFYFQKFVSARKSYGLNMNMAENDKIAMVYKKIGLNAEAKKLFSDYSAYCEADQSPYRSVSLVTKYAYEGKIDQAIEQLRLFSETDNYPYWFLLMESDPLLKPLKNHPDFASIIQKIKDRFWENHASLKEYLAEEGLVENT
jgi:tetratricopeptide (TPR) repeat protein